MAKAAARLRGHAGLEEKAEDFGALLRRRRGVSGLTQEDLAERSGLSARAIRTLERGERRRPRADTLVYLARALGLSEPERARFEEAARGGTTAAPDHLASPHNDDPVVEPPTPLIGRGDLMAQVLGLLRSGARLISLTGPGGVGKTRVGLRIAGELRPEFADGVVVADLAAITDPTLFVPTVARALGLRDAGGRPVPERLLEHLRDKEMLLLLDNFEQVKAAAPLLARLLSGSPKLKVLSTSRSALRVRGEQEVAVPPLEAPTSGTRASAAHTGRFPAVELFVERARALDLSFGLTDENALAIAEICRRLGGLPLAIELAAARTRVLFPHALLAGLDHSLALLTGGGLDLPERQRTMRRTVSWSHELLNEGEKALFRRLSVFSGGFALEAAGDVCSPVVPPETGEGSDVLDGLSSLVDASLLWRRTSPDPEGAARIGMLETVREYATERLEASGEAAAIRARHAAFYANLAEAAEPHHMGGPDHKTWLTRLEHENDNLSAALRWSRETDTETGVRLVGALCAFWWMSGRLGEGRGWTEEFLGLASNDGRLARRSARAGATRGAGQLAYGQGDLAGAASLFEEALSLGRRLGDDELAARALVELGQVRRAEGDLDRAAALSEEGLTASRRLGNPGHAAIALNTLGQIARRRGDLAGATTRHEEALNLFENLRNERGEAYTLGNLGIVALGRGDAGRSLALNQESLGLYEELRDKTGRAFASVNLGDASRQHGDEKRASHLYEQALALYRELGNERGEDRVRKRLTTGDEKTEPGLVHGTGPASS